MAVEKRILRRLVPMLLECLLILHVIGYIPSVKGDCIWYGTCADMWLNQEMNCVYNGPARPVQDETRYILNRYCPQFASGPVCCNNDQLINLKSNIELIEPVLTRCPSCLYNYMQHICGMTCSPNQSDFIKPVNVEQFNSTHQRVLEIDYHLSTTYKEATFNSCQEIPVPEINGTALELMCGDYGANCTANRFFAFLGDTLYNLYAPFQINYVGGDGPLDGYVPYNPPTRQRGWNGTEQGCQETKPTTTEDANSDNRTENNSTIPIETIHEASEKNLTIPKQSDKLTAAEHNTIPNKLHNSTQSNTIEENVGKTSCELLYQRKLQLDEDYYSFKKDYLRQKLVLLKEQTEAFKVIARELKKVARKD